MVIASETHMNAAPSSRIHEYIRAAGGRRDDYTTFDAGVYTVDYADYTAVARATIAGRWERPRAAGVQLHSGDAGRRGTRRDARVPGDREPALAIFPIRDEPDEVAAY